MSSQDFAILTTMSTLSSISCNLIIKKTIPFYISTKLIVSYNAAISHKTPKHISVSDHQWLTQNLTDPPSKTQPKFPLPPDTKPFVLPAVPRTPKVPDFDLVPPEKPADPLPLSPGTNQEFPGPPNSELPVPDEPRPPIPPGPEWLPEVFPPRAPEVIPPKPPEVGPQHPLQPDIPPPVSS